MKDVSKIEEFLKVIAKASANGLDTSEDTVYRNLIFFGLNGKMADISQNFDKWIERYANKSNINVFVATNWQYFCQFVNRNRGGITEYNAIKLYVALDKEHIYEGANLIFDYIAKENIQHVSKIGKRVRFDDVVIRVGSIEDANKIIEFVNNNNYICEGHTVLNPFAVNDGIVSIAWDGMLSYNSVLCSWVSQYIEWEKVNSNLDNVGFYRFYDFIKKKSTDVFEMGIGLDAMIEYLKQNDLNSYEDDSLLDAALLNYYDVTKLILKIMAPGFKKENVFSHIEEVTSVGYQNAGLSRISGFRKYNDFVDSNDLDNQNMIKYTEQQKNAYILAFKYMCEKYGFNMTRNSFDAFMHDGWYNRITSFKGARNLFIENGINMQIASKINADLRMESLVIENSLEKAFLETYNKYGLEQVAVAIKKLLESKNFSYITNNNNSRVCLKKSMQNLQTSLDVKYCVMEILTRYGYEFSYEQINEVCEKYYEHFNSKLMNRKR